MRSAKSLAIGAAILAVAASVGAQTTPPTAKAVRLVVPFAGGPIDVIARVLAPKLSAAMGQPFVVDNQVGNSVIAASAEVVRSPSDGHTLLVTGTGTHNLPPEAAAKLPFVPARDLLPISQLVYAANIFVARPQLGVRTLSELVVLAKSRPGQVRMAIPAVGSVTHFAATLLQRDAGMQMHELVFQGGVPAVAALLKGDADVMTASIGAVLPEIASGKLVPLAVASPQRLSQLPSVPTAYELGYPNVVALNVYGIFAPAGTPSDLVERLNAAVADALASTDLKEQIGQLGMQAQSSSPHAFDAYIKAEAAKWRPLILGERRADRM